MPRPVGKAVDLAVAGALRRGVRQGLGAGSSTWLVVGAVALTVRLLQRLAQPGKGSVITEELRPGDTLVISHLGTD